jgi:hypothetical protein
LGGPGQRGPTPFGAEAGWLVGGRQAAWELVA